MKILNPSGFDAAQLVPSRDESGNERYQVTIRSDMRMRREELLVANAHLEKLATISGPKTHQEVALALRGLNDMLKQVEADRKAVKAPLIKLGKDIDAKAEEFCAAIESQKKRLNELATAYEVEQDRLKREAEREQQRLADEARKLEQQGDEDALFEKQLEIEAVAQSTNLPAVSEPSAGMSVTTKLDYEIQGPDARKSLIKLFAAYPELVKLDPIRSAILDRLNRDRFGCPEDVIPQVPGLRVFQAVSRRFSATK